jgi:hypothetical protein
MTPVDQAGDLVENEDLAGPNQLVDHKRYSHGHWVPGTLIRRIPPRMDETDRWNGGANDEERRIDLIGHPALDGPRSL